MHLIEIILDTEYSSIPAKVKVSCNDEEIFIGMIEGKKTISHNLIIKDRLNIRISKTGMTKDIVEAGHVQAITIEQVTLNGIDLKIDAFGMFYAKGNVYLPNKELQTPILKFNGEWLLSIPPTYPLPGHLTHEGKIIQRKFVDSDICCFGASNTYRPGVKCWPHHLANLSKLKVENYGVVGSGWQEITRMVKEYSKLVQGRDLIVMSPFSFRFQIQDGDKWVNSLDHGLHLKETILHGAEHYVALLSGHLKDFFDEISASNHVHICPDNQEEYDLFQKTPLKKYIIPCIEFPEEQLLDDGHWNERWNRDFAEKTARHVGIL